MSLEIRHKYGNQWRTWIDENNNQAIKINANQAKEFFFLFSNLICCCYIKRLGSFAAYEKLHELLGFVMRYQC